MSRDDAWTQELPSTDDDAAPRSDEGTSSRTGNETAGAESSGHETSGAASTVPVAGPATPPRRGIRSGTVVWGLVLAAVGVGLLAWAAGLEFDVQLAVIVLIGVAGVALLSTSVASVRRRR